MRWIFGKPITRLREYSAPFELVLMPILHNSGNRISVSLGKGLIFFINDVFLLLKYDGNFTVLCKSNANTGRRNSTKFVAFQRILDRNETSTTFLRIFKACIILNGSNIFLDGINAT